MSVAPSKLAIGPCLFAVAAFAVLAISDWKLRRLEKVDDQVVTGQTGFSWVDEVLAQRAAHQLELRKLEDAVAAATTTQARVAARYSVVAHEAKLSRSDSRLALKMLRGIVEDGGLLPETLDARRQLISQAIVDAKEEEASGMLGGFCDVALRMPTSDAKLSRLLDAWRMGLDLPNTDSEMRLLDRILHEFPLRGEAIPAYDALERAARAGGKKAVADEAGDMLRTTQALIERQAAELQSVQLLNSHIREKNAAKAEATLSKLTPGLVPTVDYAGLHLQIVALYGEQGALAESQRLLIKTGTTLSLDKLPEPQRNSVLATTAHAQIAGGLTDEAAATLEKIPDAKVILPWKQHLQAALWLTKRGGAPPVPTAEIRATPGWSEAWYSLAADPRIPAAAGFPATRWRAVSSDGALRIQVDCAEPEPAKMVTAKTQHDSAVWEDDSIELFVTSTKEVSYHGIMVNSKGVLLDIRVKPSSGLLPPSYKEDISWSSGASVTTEQTKTGWRLTISIPWKNLAINPGDGACFLNIRRQRYVTGARVPASWTEAGLAPQDPPTMGLLLFK